MSNYSTALVSITRFFFWLGLKLTLHGQGDIDADLTLRVGRRTPVHPCVLRLHLSNKEHVVGCHHVEAVLVGSQEVASILIPHNLGLRLSFS